MKNLIVVCFVAFIVSMACAQIPEWEWAIQAGGSSLYDGGSSIAADMQGNLYVTGSFEGTVNFGATTLTSNGSRDIYAVKLDNGGNVLWAVNAGGTAYDGGSGIAVDSAGNAYLAGYFRGTVVCGSDTLISDSNRDDIFAAKLDGDGNFLWARRAGGSGDDFCAGITVDSAGNAFLTGHFAGGAFFGTHYLYSSGLYEIFAAKLGSDGNWLWAVQAGGANIDLGRKIAVDDASNAFVTGRFTGSAYFGATMVSGNQGSADVFIAKLDNSGTWLWVKRAGGSSSDDYGYDIALNNDGNAYLTGSFLGTATFGETTLISSGGYEIFAAKLDSSGNWLWAVKAGGIYNDTSYGIAVDAAGNAYLTGEFVGTAYFGTNTLTITGYKNIFTAKLDGMGNWLWAVQAGGDRDDSGYGIAVDDTANVYLTGFFQESASFGPTVLTSYGGKDIFIAKLSPGVGTDDDVQIPESAFQMMNYPNPFNPETTVSYTLPAAGMVSLQICNSRGQMVRSLLHEEQPAGEHSLIWNGKDDSGHSVASGLYLCRIACNGNQETRKMLLLK